MEPGGIVVLKTTVEECKGLSMAREVGKPENTSHEQCITRRK